MATLEQNKTTTFYVDDPAFRAYPFPKSYGKDRRVSLMIWTYDDHTDYVVCFAHSCLDWQHVRVYHLTPDEYYDLFQKLVLKYGTSKNVFTSDMDRTYSGEIMPAQQHIDFKFDWHN